MDLLTRSFLVRVTKALQRSGMVTYYDKQLEPAGSRLHPYTPAPHSPAGCVDFKAHPELIETVLEDFRPFEGRPAIQTFYAFIRWINGPESHLETSDCGLKPPGPHNDRNSTRPLRISGRVFVLFRNLQANCDPNFSSQLLTSLNEQVGRSGVRLTENEAVIGFSFARAIHTAISNGTWKGEDFAFDQDDPGIGRHIILSFFVYGDDEESVFENLDRAFKGLWHACRAVNLQIEDAIRRDQTRRVPSSA